MNLKIKYRESFRPFAPSVLEEEVTNQFEMNKKSPYMLLVAPIKKKLCTKMTKEQDKLFGIEKLNIPFKHFETTKVGYIRKEKFS